MTREELFKLHAKTCEEALTTMKAKNQDYSKGDDPFRNFRGSEMFNVDPKKGILLRIGDKMQRINSFIDRGHLLVANEGVFDSIEDNINYLILLKGMIIESSISETNKDSGSILPADVGNSEEREEYERNPGMRR